MRSLIVTIFLLLLVKAVSSQVLHIPYGPAISNDGVVNSTEWMGADTVLIQQSSIYTTSVLYKHDGQNLYIAFERNLQSPFMYFPEVNIDANHDGTNTFQNDDWWFHVSATDCEYQGSYGVYHNCQAARPNWTANPNFSSSGPLVNKVEVSIPFQTIGVQSTDTVGILFFLNNFQSFKYHDPTANHLDPSSWTTAVLDPLPTSIIEKKITDLKIFPNPSEGSFHLQLEDARLNSPYTIRDFSGKQIESGTISKWGKVDLGKYPSGIYFIEVEIGNRALRKKLIKS